MVTMLLLGGALLLWPGHPPGVRPLRWRLRLRHRGFVASEVFSVAVPVADGSLSNQSSARPPPRTATGLWAAAKWARWQAGGSGRTGWVRAVLVPAAAAVLTALLTGPAVGMAVGAMAATVRHLVRTALDRRRSRREVADLAEGLRLLARELRAGSTVELAARFAAEESRGAAARVLIGLIGAEDTSSRGAARRAGSTGVSQRLGRMGSGVADEIADRLRTGRALSYRYGVSLATLVEAIARDLSDTAVAADARAGQVAGPATSGYVLAGLPLAGLLLGSGMGADPWGVLTRSAVGGLLLLAGTVLTCAGLLWSARIVRP